MIPLVSIIPSVLNGVITLMEVVVKGRGEGATKKQLGVDIAHTILTEFAKSGKLPAVPPKDELSGLVDGAVAIKNAQGWDKAPAITGIVLSGAQLANFFIEAFNAGKTSQPTS